MSFSDGKTRMVEKDLHNFINILNDLRIIHGKMVIALRMEQEAIQKLDTDKMESTLNQKNKLLTMLSSVDGNRQALFDRICDHYEENENIRPETLFELSEMVKGEVGIKIKKILRSLRFLAKTVQEYNQVNEIVIEESVKRVQSIRRHLASLMGVNAYDAAGRVVNKL